MFSMVKMDKSLQFEIILCTSSSLNSRKHCNTWLHTSWIKEKLIFYFYLYSVLNCRLKRHLVYLGLKNPNINIIFNIRTRTSKVGRIFYVQTGQVRYQVNNLIASFAVKLLTSKVKAVIAEPDNPIDVLWKQQTLTAPFKHFPPFSTENFLNKLQQPENTITVSSKLILFLFLKITICDL